MEKLMNKLMMLFTVSIAFSMFVACGDLETVKPEASGQNTVTVSGAKACESGVNNIPYANAPTHVASPFSLNGINQSATKEFLASFSTDFACLSNQSTQNVSAEVSFDFSKLGLDFAYPKMSLNLLIEPNILLQQTNNGVQRLQFLAKNSKDVDFQYNEKSLYALFYFANDIVITVQAKQGLLDLWSGDITLSYTTADGQSRFTELGRFNSVSNSTVTN